MLLFNNHKFQLDGSKIVLSIADYETIGVGLIHASRFGSLIDRWDKCTGINHYNQDMDNYFIEFNFNSDLEASAMMAMIEANNL